MVVIITIMAFELKTPANANWHGLQGRIPLLLVYILSFTIIGIYWNNHHHLLRATHRISAGVMWTNLHLTLLVVAHSLRHEVGGGNHARALPAATYGVVALGAALAYFALVRAILRANVDDDVIVAAIGRDVKGVASPVIYVAGTGLAFVSPYLAYACYSAVSLKWLVPNRRLATSASQVR